MYIFSVEKNEKSARSHLVTPSVHNNAIGGIGRRKSQLNNPRLRKTNQNSVCQLDLDIARTNWARLAQYSPNMANNVERAFTRAGYPVNSLADLIPRIANRLGYGNAVYAHGTGNSDSGLQGDTNARFQAMANGLIAWAAKNPYVPKEKSSNYSGSRRDDGGDKGGKGGKGGKSSRGNKTDERFYKASWAGGFPAW